MSAEQKTPADIARGLAKRARTQAASHEGAWRRETYTLKRNEARAKARAYFAKFPKAAYMTEIESLAGTLRRPHRIHDPPPAQRRLIARGKERCVPNAVRLRTFRQQRRPGSLQRKIYAAVRRFVFINEPGTAPEHFRRAANKAFGSFAVSSANVPAGMSHLASSVKAP